MKFISLDIECDQPSGNCIQIGAAAWDTDHDEPVDTLDLYLRPDAPVNWDHMLSCDKTLRQYVGWTVNHHELNAIDSITQLVLFNNWLDTTQGSGRVVQWGTGDYQQLKTELPALPMTNIINCQQIYSHLYQPAMRLFKGRGQQKAAATLGIQYPGNPHDALADAIVCGKIYLKMFKDLNKLRCVNELFKSSI